MRTYLIRSLSTLPPMFAALPRNAGRHRKCDVDDLGEQAIVCLRFVDMPRKRLAYRNQHAFKTLRVRIMLFADCVEFAREVGHRRQEGITTTWVGRSLFVGDRESARMIMLVHRRRPLRAGGSYREEVPSGTGSSNAAVITSPICDTACGDGTMIA